jgi:hypothetical protein
MVAHSPRRRNGGKNVTLAQLIAQMRVERAQAATHLHKLDSALAELTKTTVAPTTAPNTGTGRVWTPEQKLKLSVALKKRWAAKKRQAKG